MGSKSSGRRGQRSFRSTTDDSRVLSIKPLVGSLTIPRGTVIETTWSRDNKVTFSVTLTYLGDCFDIAYTLWHRDGSSLRREYSIGLTWSACNYGGKRAWFVCPNQNCQRRVAKLYLSGQGYFICRHCAQLAYESQYESLGDRLVRKAEKIRKRLDWQPGLVSPSNGKPKYMHESTYAKYESEYWGLLNQLFGHWGVRMPR